MKKALQLLGCASVLLCVVGHGFAFTSISSIPGQNAILFPASNYDSQAKADNAALAGCRSTAKYSGLAKLANKCSVLGRGPGPGYGAYDCGDGGCSWRLGYPSAQQAVNAATYECILHFSNCQHENVPHWADFAGFPNPSRQQEQFSNENRPQAHTMSTMDDVYAAHSAANRTPPAPLSMAQLGQMAQECDQAQRERKPCQSVQEFLQTHPRAQ
jgi:hypothetical protein